MLRNCRGMPVLLATLVAACGGGANASGDAAESQTPQLIASARGTLTVGGVTHPFHVVRCDLTGAEDGMLLRGTGSTADGRRIAIEVERIPGEEERERASVYFGELREGNQLQARRSQASEPLIRISGSELVIEAVFTGSTGQASGPGVLRATCEST